MAAFSFKEINNKAYHKKLRICGSRARYRDGRKGTAVKVYTLNQESCYLLIQGVPAVGAREELQSLCEQFGQVEVQPLDEYPCEEFTEVYLASYHWFPAARTAKKNLDDKSFFGGTLHVCYAPEFETVDDTRKKLQERRKFISFKCKEDIRNMPDAINTKPKTTDMKHTSDKNKVSLHQPVTYIWAGKEYTVYPNQPEPPDINIQTNVEDSKKPSSNSQLIPRSVSVGKKDRKRTYAETI